MKVDQLSTAWHGAKAYITIESGERPSLEDAMAECVTHEAIGTCDEGEGCFCVSIDESARQGYHFLTQEELREELGHLNDK